jgi:hypothetical protein
MGRRLILRDYDPQDRMSALGQKQTSDQRPSMSALPPKADIAGRQLDVRFVARSRLMHRNKMSHYSITSSARVRIIGGAVIPIALTVLRLIIVERRDAPR